MILKIEHTDFIPIERMNILKDLIETEFTINNDYFKITDHITNVEQQIVVFLCNPEININFAILDTNSGKRLLEIHHEFWNYYYEKRDEHSL